MRKHFCDACQSEIGEGQRHFQVKTTSRRLIDQGARVAFRHICFGCGWTVASKILTSDVDKELSSVYSSGQADINVSVLP